MIRTALAAVMFGVLFVAAMPAVAEQQRPNPTTATYLAAATEQTPVMPVRRYVYYGAPGWYGYVGPPAYPYYTYRPYVNRYYYAPPYYEYYPGGGYDYAYPSGMYYSGPRASFYFGF